VRVPTAFQPRDRRVRFTCAPPNRDTKDKCLRRRERRGSGKYKCAVDLAGVVSAVNNPLRGEFHVRRFTFASCVIRKERAFFSGRPVCRISEINVFRSVCSAEKFRVFDGSRLPGRFLSSRFSFFFFLLSSRLDYRRYRIVELSNVARKVHLEKELISRGKENQERVCYRKIILLYV